MAEQVEQSQPRWFPERLRWPLALGLVVVVHLALVVHFIAPSRVLTAEPIMGDDFDLHIGQTYRTIEGLDGWGHTWIYDVDMLAGQPAGVIVDSGNKGWSLWTWALHRLGLDRAIAFNLFVLLPHLLCPLAIFVCARTLRLSRVAALSGAALGSLFWYFDSFAHWVWWIGMCSFATASCSSLLAFAFFYRFVEERHIGYGLVSAVVAALTLLIHPYSFFVLLLPLALTYFRSFRQLGAREHGVVALVVLSPLLVNGYWLHNALSHWHYILDSAFYGQSGPHYALADVMGITLSPTDTGVIGTRTGFRMLLLALAGCTLLLWRRERDRRFGPVGLTLLFLVFFVYVGGSLPGARQVQPYRFMLPAGLIAALMSGVFLAQLKDSAALGRLSFPQRALLLVLSLSVGQHLARQALYFFPELVPKSPPLIDGTPSPLSSWGYLTHYEWPEHVTYRIPRDEGAGKDARDVVRWVRENIGHGERVLVDMGVLGERLAWATDVEVMGGFRMRNIQHARANFFRRFGNHPVPLETLRQYFRTFAIGWVILHQEREDFEAATALLHPLESFGNFQIYRVKLRASRVLEGPGEVTAGSNRIAVRGTRPEQPVLLSYHFHEALRCAPDCRIERLEVELDDVGLIRVPAPHPSNFVIENGY
ncbi:MAG: hypothetical protein OEZ06_00030 [Myxococcales bacterium]|nr:hypothetical protein [Myxococcales bacterium]